MDLTIPVGYVQAAWPSANGQFSSRTVEDSQGAGGVLLWTLWNAYILQSSCIHLLLVVSHGCLFVGLDAESAEAAARMTKICEHNVLRDSPHIWKGLQQTSEVQVFQ